MMRGSDRGMVKYQPYKSLVEQSAILARMRYEKNKQSKPWISSDRAEEINEILVHYAREEARLEYWEDGYRYALFGSMDRIDVTRRVIAMKGKSIAFSQLVNLERV